MDSLFTKRQKFDLSKSKAFAEDKFYVAQILESVFERIENMMEIGENAGSQHFFLFSIVFSNDFFLKVVRTQELKPECCYLTKC